MLAGKLPLPFCSRFDHKARMRESARQPSKRERVIIDLAVEILQEGVDEAGKAKVNTVAVRLALRCLLPHCPEKWPLVSYWDSSSQDNDIGRCSGVTAGMNGIMVQLRRSGAR